MARYEADIDLGNRNLSHTQVVELVGRNKTVLDVGCATGDVARALNAQGCRVSGVEIDIEAAEKARPDLDQLVIADLNTSPLSEHFKAGTFDAIIFADVLEHVLDPDRVLQDSISLLAPGGQVVVSIPNVTHGSVRLSLLQGRWNYTDTGLLDGTHVRFFTRSSFIALLQDAGLAIDQLRSTVADPLSTEVDVDGDQIPPSVIEWVRGQPDALNYQFIARAYRLAEGGTPGDLPTLVPALPDTVVRAEDRFTNAMRVEQAAEEQRRLEEQGLRHHLLTVRDHIIGLEARVATAQSRNAQAQGRANRAEARARKAEEQLTEAQAQIRRLKARLVRQQQQLDRTTISRVSRALAKPFRGDKGKG